MASNQLLKYVVSIRYVSPNPEYIFISYLSKYLEFSHSVTIGLLESSEKKSLLP